MAIKAKKVKCDSRTRTKRRIRRKIVGKAERARLSVFKSSKHIYAQIISDLDSKTLVSASTLDKDVIDQIGQVNREGLHGEAKSSKSVAAAKAVGIVLAKRSLEKQIGKVVFDRNGFVYKGRVKALADGAREAGLDF